MIVTNGDESEELEIGSGDSGLFFTDDPIEISSEVNDTFDVLLRTSACNAVLAADKAAEKAETAA